jgi:hypothetical protein
VLELAAEGLYTFGHAGQAEPTGRGGGFAVTIVGDLDDEASRMARTESPLQTPNSMMWPGMGRASCTASSITWLREGYVT